MANSANSSGPYQPDRQPALPVSGNQSYPTRALGDPAPADSPGLSQPPLADGAGFQPQDARQSQPLPRPPALVLITLGHALVTALITYGLVSAFLTVHDWWIVMLIPVVLLGLSIISMLIAIGVGFWRMKSWALIAVIAGYGYHFYTTVLSINDALGLGWAAYRAAPWEFLASVLTGLAALAATVYLLQPATRAMFRR